MRKRYERLNEASKGLAKEAYKAYAGKKDYKRALECFLILSESLGVPCDIKRYSKKMLGQLSKKIDDTKK